MMLWSGVSLYGLFSGLSCLPCLEFVSCYRPLLHLKYQHSTCRKGTRNCPRTHSSTICSNCVVSVCLFPHSPAQIKNNILNSNSYQWLKELIFISSSNPKVSEILAGRILSLFSFEHLFGLTGEITTARASFGNRCPKHHHPLL